MSIDWVGNISRLDSQIQLSKKHTKGFTNWTSLFVCTSGSVLIEINGTATIDVAIFWKVMIKR